MRRPDPRRAGGVAILSVLAVLLLFAGALLIRWHSHFANVDDYLYALQTRGYLDGLKGGPGRLVDAWQAQGTSAPLVPTLALPVAAIDSSPQALVVVQLLPLLLLVASVRSLLADLGLTARAAWVGTAAIATLAPVLAYAAMYHFALAATACTALAAAAYARSERLARLRPALVLGAALGLLAITRVMAPVYVVALALPVAVDVLASGRDRGRRMRNGALAALLGAVVAAPWWIATGGSALHYLRTSGYGNSAFTHAASPVARIRDRLDWTATETGWLLALLLVALAVWAVVVIARRGPRARLLGWLLATVLSGLAFLSTSTNLGTAFGLPFVVLLACAGAAAVAHLPPRARSAALAAATGVLGVSLLGLYGAVPKASLADRSLWNESLPSIQQARAVLACDSCRPPDSGELAAEALAVIGSRPTLLARDDALLNANSLRYAAHDHDATAALVEPAGPAPPLAGVDYVVAGATLAPYHPGVAGPALDARLRAAGFRLVFSRRPSAWNSVEIWAAPAVARR